MSRRATRAPADAAYFKRNASTNPYCGMKKPDLHRALNEAQTMLDYHEAAIARYQAIKAMIGEEWARIGAAPYVKVTDHAIVRFIERFGGCNMDEVRAGITALIAAGRPEVVILNDAVITILPEGVPADGTRPGRPDVDAAFEATLAEAIAMAARGTDGPV